MGIAEVDNVSVVVPDRSCISVPIYNVLSTSLKANSPGSNTDGGPGSPDNRLLICHTKAIKIFSEIINK